MKTRIAMTILVAVASYIGISYTPLPNSKTAVDGVAFSSTYSQACRSLKLEDYEVKSNGENLSLSAREEVTVPRYLEFEAAGDQRITGLSGHTLRRGSTAIKKGDPASRIRELYPQAANKKDLMKTNFVEVVVDSGKLQFIIEAGRISLIYFESQQRSRRAMAR